MPDQEQDEESQAFRIPMKLVIVGFIVGLVSLGGWALALERGKADKEEVRTLNTLMFEQIKEVKSMIREVGQDIKDHSRADKR